MIPAVGVSSAAVSCDSCFVVSPYTQTGFPARPTPPATGSGHGMTAFGAPPPAVPAVRVHNVATGGLVQGRGVPVSAGREVSNALADGHARVFVLDLGGARFETQTLLEMLAEVWRAASGTVQRAVVVVATDQPSVIRVVQMVAAADDLPLYVMPTGGDLSLARPAGRLTPTEADSLMLLAQLGGEVTANRFAHEASLELTAAGNRLAGLAKRGYVLRVPRSRRDGDLYVGLPGHRPAPPDLPYGATGTQGPAGSHGRRGQRGTGDGPSAAPSVP